MNYAVTIIVPVYGVEKYIEQCADSLFRQDFESIEYIFVNDCTLDNSVVILEQLIDKYPDRKLHTRIIHHERNKGSGAARKTGILNAAGEYIIQIDSDDWCELDIISELYNQAKKDSADIVMCDFYETYSNRDVYREIKYERGREFSMLLSAELIGACWNKLIKRSLYFDNNVFPSEAINMAEDKHLIIRLAFFAKQFSYIDKALIYYRQDNEDAQTKKISNSSIDDIKYFICEIKKFLILHNILDKYYAEFDNLIIDQAHYVSKRSKFNLGLSVFQKIRIHRILLSKQISFKHKIRALLYFPFFVLAGSK